MIIMPAYNEELNITSVVQDWHSIIERYGDTDSRLVVINDGSKDNTLSVLNSLLSKYPKLEVLDKKNSGHGSTLHFGYQYALRKNANYIFQTDSDGQTSIEDFDKFWTLRESYEAIIGHRKHRQDGFSRIIVTRVLKLVLWAIFGVKISDANTPYRLMNRNLLNRYLQRIPDTYNLTNVMLTVFFVKHQHKVEFVPVHFGQRQAGINSINIPKIIKIGLFAIEDFQRFQVMIKNEASTPKEFS